MTPNWFAQSPITSLPENCVHTSRIASFELRRIGVAAQAEQLATPAFVSCSNNPQNPPLPWPPMAAEAVSNQCTAENATITLPCGPRHVRALLAIIVKWVSRRRPCNARNRAQILIDSANVTIGHVSKSRPSHNLEKVTVEGRRNPALIHNAICTRRVQVI